MDRAQASQEQLVADRAGNPQLVVREVSPFLKWAGGKRWFVQNYSSLFPSKYSRYLEPFLGSGAVFFHLAPETGILADKNAELIQAYQTVRDDWEAISRELAAHHEKHSAGHYYRIRKQRLKSPVRRAARFIYLNRTCWNGLYRVNREGMFNVPVGTKTSVVLPTDDFKGVAALLHRVRIEIADYTDTVAQAGQGDFVFVDPPYVTKRHNGSFIKYNEKLFAWTDQIALRDCLVEASKRGAKILATNANNKLLRKLYEQDFDVTTASRGSVISGSTEGRGRCSELVIRNY